MSLRPTCSVRAPAVALCGAFALFAGAVFAADPPAAASADTTYQKERARCLAGQSGQAQETCLKEAGAARQMARDGQLTEGDAANEKKRCDVQTGDAKRDCLARASGSGVTTSSGSVKEGGVLRSTTTVVPAASAAASAR